MTTPNDPVQVEPLTAEEEADWRRQLDIPNDGYWSDDDVRRILATLDAERAEHELTTAALASAARLANDAARQPASPDPSHRFCTQNDPCWESHGPFRQPASPDLRAEYRFTTWGDSTLVITVDDDDPGDIGEPREVFDYDADTAYVSVRAALGETPHE
jgi:hypothetical protein